jgi:hypothetical protein
MLITDIVIDDPGYAGNQVLHYGLPEILETYGGPTKSIEELPAVVEALSGRVAIIFPRWDELDFGSLMSEKCGTVPCYASAAGSDGNVESWPIDVTIFWQENN